MFCHAGWGIAVLLHNLVVYRDTVDLVVFKGVDIESIQAWTGGPVCCTNNSPISLSCIFGQTSLLTF